MYVTRNALPPTLIITEKPKTVAVATQFTHIPVFLCVFDRLQLIPINKHCNKTS